MFCKFRLPTDRIPLRIHGAGERHVARDAYLPELEPWPRILQIHELAQMNAEAGKFWFSEGARRFFKSRWYGPAVHGPENGYYFVSSEKGPDKVRRYSVRVFWPGTAAVDTVGEFQAWPRLDSARRALQRILKGGVS